MQMSVCILFVSMAMIIPTEGDLTAQQLAVLVKLLAMNSAVPSNTGTGTGTGTAVTGGNMVPTTETAEPTVESILGDLYTTGKDATAKLRTRLINLQSQAEAARKQAGVLEQQQGDESEEVEQPATQPEALTTKAAQLSSAAAILTIVVGDIDGFTDKLMESRGTFIAALPPPATTSVVQTGTLLERLLALYSTNQI
ncbi:hypothetical protein SNE40_016667 [Patella caerulea]|uniref:Secreted protein n=1 Tax=Patella caerulea TaxID=87958 RepID=A0AAN8PCL8_PATCE